MNYGVRLVFEICLIVSFFYMVASFFSYSAWLHNKFISLFEWLIYEITYTIHGIFYYSTDANFWGRTCESPHETGPMSVWNIGFLEFGATWTYSL